MLNYLKAYVNGASGISVGNPENRTTKTITAKNLNIMSNGEDGFIPEWGGCNPGKQHLCPW